MRSTWRMSYAWSGKIKRNRAKRRRPPLGIDPCESTPNP
jgi:hypothetical protein